VIKAVIFDCYGVLTGEGLVRFREQHFGSQPDYLKASQDLTHQMVLGTITFDDMLRGFAKMTELSYEEVALEIESFDKIKNNELLDFIKNDLKPHYKIGVLSNIGEHKFETVFNTEERKLFDAIALSCEIGCAKPDKKAYEIVARMLDVQPKEAIFVDDREKYIEGAKKVGMSGIKYVSFALFKNELNEKITESNREKTLTFNHKNDSI
jgi:HAD superfamily hydrolase (TIGR01509 family)